MDADEFDVGAAPAAPDKLEALNAVLASAIELEASVLQLEEDLKAARAALNKLRTGSIPDMMAELGIDAVTFRGWKVSVSEFVSASFPKAGPAHERAINWLEAAGAGGLIKTDLSIAFGRSQHNEALDLAARLTQEGLAPALKSGVHSQTLAAFAQERIRNGEPLDLDVLGLYVGKVAKLAQVAS